MPELHDYLDEAALASLIAAARLEDLGSGGRDATTALFVDPAVTAEARVVARRAGVLSGLALAPRIISAFDPRIGLETHAADGDSLKRDQAVATLAGPLSAILTLERTLLNFLGHLSGIATHSAAFVDAVQGTSARIYDTRKTIPGMRALAKYAVACGGGCNHRVGLYDAVLLKDNHLAHVPPEELGDALRAMVRRARSTFSDLKFIMVELDRLDQFEQVLHSGVDLVLLDNMSPQIMAEAVARRDRLAPHVQLEASGNVNLETVRAIAQSGVDRISVGALTHSAANFDLGLDIA